MLNAGLGGSLQRSIEVGLVSKDIVKFGEFMQAFANPTGFCIYAMEPLIGSAMLAVESNLGFSLIDCMFGGDGKPLAKVRDFTRIEQRMLDRFYNEVLQALEKAWAAAYTITISTKRTESKPEFVNLVGPNDLVMTTVLSVKSEAFSGNMHICTPYLMLDPIKDKLSSRYLREKDRGHAFGDQMNTLLKDTAVNVVAELGRTTHTIGQILGLENGDIVRINTGPQDAVTLNVEGIPKFFGTAGVVKGNRAVQITELISKDEGE
jgi:flagellar motor switch protein FliM